MTMEGNVNYPGSQWNVAECARDALKKSVPDISLGCEFPPLQMSRPNIQWSDYDRIDWDLVNEGGRANSYPIRKALIRKNHLAQTIRLFTAKREQSILKKTVPTTYMFDLSYADELDELLMDDLYELGQSLEENNDKENEDKTWWILKPAFTSGGDGIHVFSSLDELQCILEEAEYSDEEENDEQQESFTLSTSTMRQWIVQKYITHPLLVNGIFEEARKFHLRIYVVAIGALQVYVHVPFNALFASKAYKQPGADGDLLCQLTNTCLQDINDEGKREVVFTWDSVTEKGITRDGKITKESIKKLENEIVLTVGDLFRAAQSSGPGFQTYEQCFEIFGVDFLVDDEMNPWLLEVNACPDFGQLPGEQMWVVRDLFEATSRLIFNKSENERTLIQAL